MAKYQIKRGQNLFDIAIHLYGSIEGIYDLLISNPRLNLNTDLKAGMELEYHDTFIINEGIVSEIIEKGYLPANGERHVYFKNLPTDELKLMVETPCTREFVELTLAGSGNMTIDWGDNTSAESIVLTNASNRITHYFDNVVDQPRYIRMYGDFELSSLDMTKCDGDLYAVRPTKVDTYISACYGGNIAALPLFTGLLYLDLRNKKIDDLSPIYGIHLAHLDLRNAYFDSVDVLDDYLINLVENHEDRRNCIVYLTMMPSDRGMEAINTIINEESWNSSGNWCFNINGINYSAE